jgi:iron complex outermembrane recepter protein
LRLTANVSKARSAAVGAELIARPTEKWDFGVSATHAGASLRASYVLPLTSPTNPVGMPTVVSGLASGARLPTATKLQAVASIRYTLPSAFAGKWDFFANAVGQYVGSSYTEIADEVAGFGTVSGGGLIRFSNPVNPDGSPKTSITVNPEVPAYHIGNLRLGIRSGGTEISAYVNNFTNEQAYLSFDRERGTRARMGYLTNPPRSIGIVLRQSL